MAYKYENGFMSRSQIGSQFKIKGFSWHIIQKAMIRGGWLIYDPNAKEFVPSEKATGLHAMHREVDDETGHFKEWLIWSPKIVDLIRDDVEWVRANPGIKIESERPDKIKPDRVYPEGYLSIPLIAKAVGCKAKTVRDVFVEWEIGEYNSASGRFMPVYTDPLPSGYRYAYLYKEEQNGKFEEWWVWNPDHVEKLNYFFECNPERRV
jgi:hypothetical protein